MIIIVNALNTIKAIYVLPQSGCDIFPNSQKMKVCTMLSSIIHVGMHVMNGFAPLIMSYMTLCSFEKLIHE